MFLFHLNHIGEKLPDFTELCSQWSNWQYARAGSVNGFTPNRRQAIICPNQWWTSSLKPICVTRSLWVKYVNLCGKLNQSQLFITCPPVTYACAVSSSIKLGPSPIRCHSTGGLTEVRLTAEEIRLPNNSKRVHNQKWSSSRYQVSITVTPYELHCVSNHQ